MSFYDGNQLFYQGNEYGYGREQDDGYYLDSQGRNPNQPWDHTSQFQENQFDQPSQASTEPTIQEMLQQMLQQVEVMNMSFEGMEASSERLTTKMETQDQFLEIAASMESLDTHNTQASSYFQGDRIESMLQTLIEAQAKAQLEVNEKLMEMQLMRSFPSKTEENQRANCNVILNGHKGEEVKTSRSHIDEAQLEENERFLEDFTKLLDSPIDEKVAKGEQGPIVGSKIDVGSAKKMNEEGHELKKEESLRVYEPKLPFPPRVYTKKEKYVFSQFKRGLDQIGITLPLNEYLAQVPLQVKFIKDILANKEKVEELMQQLEPPSPPSLEGKELTKLGDPGKFIIPCSLGGFKVDDALCDSGAFVNVISLDMVKEFGIKGMKPNKTFLTFGDASTKTPKGIIEDYPVMVGNCIVPTDLLVFDMVGSKRQPLILGAPFLTTVGATIDYVKKVVVLKNVDDKVFYAIEPPLGFCGTITNGEATIEKKEPHEVKDTPNRVENVLKVDTKLRDEPDMEMFGNLFDDGSESVDESHVSMVDQVLMVEKKPKDEVPVVKKPRSKKMKLAKASCVPHEPRYPPLTFQPLMLHDGKLECKVVCKGGSKPFAKARILLPPNVEANGMNMITDSMAQVFNMKLEDRGPFQDGSLSTSRA